MKRRIVTLILTLVLLGNLHVYADGTFTDVNEPDYFYVSVLYTSGKGIIHGIGNNTFNPYGVLTVAEGIKLAACIHADFYGADLELDATSKHWVDVYYNYAVENGIINSDDFLKSDFDKPIIRDRLFYMFAKSLPEKEYPEINEMENAPEKNTTDYVKKLFCAGIVIGTENGFELENNITRADSVEVVTRMTAYSKRRLVFGDE